jgi:D-lyxose ketol-isomerase
MSTTPQVGQITTVTAGGTAVTAIAAVAAGIGGGFITNPYSPTDQGLSNAEPLTVDITGEQATLEGNGSTVALQPGESVFLVPGQVTAVTVNAESNGHQFTAVWWP